MVRDNSSKQLGLFCRNCFKFVRYGRFEVHGLPHKNKKRVRLSDDELRDVLTRAASGPIVLFASPFKPQSLVQADLLRSYQTDSEGLGSIVSTSEGRLRVASDIMFLRLNYRLSMRLCWTSEVCLRATKQFLLKCAYGSPLIDIALCSLLQSFTLTSPYGPERDNDNRHFEEDGDGVSEEDGSRGRRSSCRKWFTD